MVKCPNNCYNGKVKHYSDKIKALFELVTCPYCRGKGEVPKEQYDRINKSI